MSKAINTWMRRLRRASERVNGLEAIQPWPGTEWPRWSVW
jgi:hypothetical protein